MSAENISYDLKRFAGIKRDYNPEEIERLELEIKKLEEFLSIDDLYQSDQKKFDKASSALAERKLKIDKIMEEWLLLEDKQIYGQLS